MIRLEPGSQIGRYRIRRRLGAGAMGEVYLAEDPHIGRELAIKTVRVEEGKAHEIEERKRRLLREARAAGKLLHPNVVALFDAGEEGEILYLAFEFVDGMDLADRITQGPPLTIAEALSMVRQAAEALDYAHRQGVVHRDIKPSNLMVTPDGRVKVADFGIAKVLDQTSDLTMTGSVVGSPHYLSPEQIRGEELDGRTDIFSLGVLLYEILCRRRPFEADTLTTLVYQILHQEPKPVAELRPELGPRLERLVRRMMHKDRDQRFANAAELAAEILGCERDLAPALLHRRAQPDDPTEATTLLPDEAVTAARAAPAPTPTAAMPSPPNVAPPLGGAASSRSRGRLGLVLVAGTVIVAVLLAVGVGARRWTAQRAERQRGAASADTRSPAGSAARTAPSEKPAAVATAAGKVQLTDAGREEAAAAGIEPQGVADPQAGEPELPYQPGERPVFRRAVAPSLDSGGVDGPGPRASTEAAPPLARQTSPPVREAADELETPAAARMAEPEAAAADRTPEPSRSPPPRPVRDALVERVPVDREMQTGMSLSFELEPKRAADRIVVRFDRIVIGRAADWDASKRGGRSYSIPEPGLHILTFLVDGSEVYRIRIDARSGGPAPTRIQVNLPPQFGRR